MSRLHDHRLAAFGAAICLLIATVLATSAAAQDPLFDMYIIEPWDEVYDLATSFVADINELNTAVGTATVDGGTRADFYWTEDLGKQEADIGPYQINNQGVTASNGAIFWSPGDYTTLPLPPGAHSIAVRDLNNNNVIVGSSGYGETAGAIVWDEENGTRWLVDLGVPPFAWHAYAINDAGRIAASHSHTGEPGDEKAFVYELYTGEYTYLHGILNPSGPGITRAVDVAENGIVAGEGSKEAFGGGIAAWIWTPEDGFTFLPGLNGGETMRVGPASVNSTGAVVGSALDGTDEWRAFLWSEAEGMRDLEDLAEVPAGFNLQGATVINENGWILGLGFWGEAWGPQRAVVFVPRVPDTLTAVDDAPDGTRLMLRSSGPSAAPGALLSFTLPADSAARLTVYDVRGREIATVVDGSRAAGEHSVRWNGRADDGRRVHSGVYLAQLVAGGQQATAKVLVMR